MLNPSDVQEAVRAKLAAEIVERLTPDEITALLTNTLTALLEEWTFKTELRDALAKRARKIAKEILKSEEWEGKIRQAVMDGFDDYLENLSPALEDTLNDTFIGSSGQFGHQSRLGYFLEKRTGS